MILNTNPVDMAAKILDLEQQIQDGNAQRALQTKAMRQMLENKLTGADGAAGTVVALEGGQTSIDVTLGNAGGQ